MMLQNSATAVTPVATAPAIGARVGATADTTAPTEGAM